jgi:hypothetical protein
MISKAKVQFDDLDEAISLTTVIINSLGQAAKSGTTTSIIEVSVADLSIRRGMGAFDRIKQHLAPGDPATARPLVPIRAYVYTVV